ncbi:MAG: adenine phosphoribosyltransferase [Anaerovibrio sp.]|uniref:adenine phosphoribosyltransferase n=1 Tax=Anaerovibrio sp. TaxID=1872532 RepID=UPI0025EED34C|nr:adenine phosphoribosyltransferase [Anaerovibrio sp.]MCR5175325.1 adenine phosphoribosyltransferase [Anaerovibrio sp.]
MSLSAQEINYVKEHVRVVPDFPKKGIQFVDITTTLKNAKAFGITLDFMKDALKDKNIDLIVGLESRGFIYGAALSAAMNIGFVPIRKPGKLPSDVVSVDYELEYGTDRIEMHKDAIKPGQNIMIVDDLLATGGTADAAAKLIKKVGGNITGAVFFVELSSLGGRKKLEADGINVVSMLQYDLD